MAALSVKRGRGRPLGQSDDLTQEELEALVKVPDRRSKKGLRDAAVILLFANSPMRKGEMCALDVGNLLDEGAKKFISYKALKKRKRRNKETGEIETKQKPYWVKIPIDARVFDVIIRYVQAEHKGKRMDRTAPLFQTMGTRGPYKKRRITSWAIDAIVSLCAKTAGINKRVTPHSFRASYVTLRSTIADPKTLQDLGGWSSLNGVMPYFRSSEKKKFEAAMARSVV